MASAPTDLITDIALPLALPYALTAIRVGAALRLLPFFGGGSVPWVVWSALTVALTLAVAPLHVSPAPAIAPGTAFFIVLAMKELFIGAVIGTLGRIAFSVMEMVGHLAHVSALPFSAGENKAGLPAFYTLTGAAVFVLLGGHHSLIEGLLATFRCHPVTAIPVTDLNPEPVIRLFAATMAAAVLAAVPIFSAGIVSDLLVGGIAHLLSSAPIAGATSVRGIVVLTVAAASMSGVVAAMLKLLGSTLDGLAACSGF